MLLWAFCEQWPDVRSHLQPRWSRRTIKHNASHSTEQACQTRFGQLALALRPWPASAQITLDSSVLLLFRAFIHFEGYWACLALVVIDTTDKARSTQLQSLEIVGKRREREKKKKKLVFSWSARTAVKVPSAYRESPDALFLAVCCSFQACSGQKSLG